MSLRAVLPTILGAILFGTIAKADDQQVVETYLESRGIRGAVVRPVTDDFVGRTFPNFNFFGVIFRQYPVAVQCPQVQDLKCSNVFFVKEGQVDIASSIQSRVVLAAALGTAAAGDVASTWLRLSEELKQDLFYTFSAPEIAYEPRDDVTRVRAKAAVTGGGTGRIRRGADVRPSGEPPSRLREGRHPARSSPYLPGDQAARSRSNRAAHRENRISWSWAALPSRTSIRSE